MHRETSEQHYSDYITPAQFHEACIDLANDLKEEGGSDPDEFGYPKGAKFRVLDLRQEHEKEIKDLADYILVDTESEESVKVEIPRHSLEYAELTTNMYDDQFLTRSVWFVLLCQRGLTSGQAHNNLKRKGYMSKILLGGVDALPKELLKF